MDHYTATPVVRYGPDARGPDVPDFGVIFSPQCMQSPALSTIVPRLPNEPGVAFHARVIELAYIKARLLAMSPEWTGVFFTSWLPSVAYRRWEQQRNSLRWSAALPGTPPRLKAWARAKLAELVKEQSA